MALIDPVTGAPVRSTWRFLEDGTKVRAATARSHAEATGRMLVMAPLGFGGPRGVLGAVFYIVTGEPF